MSVSENGFWFKPKSSQNPDSDRDPNSSLVDKPISAGEPS